MKTKPRNSSVPCIGGGGSPKKKTNPLSPSKLPRRTPRKVLAPCYNEAIVFDFASPPPKPLAANRASRSARRKKSPVVTSDSENDNENTVPPEVKTPSPKKKSKKTVKRAVTPKPEVDLDKLSKLLHVSAVPDRLACREEEFQVIHDFVLNNVQQRKSRSYYISGVPGTGKTATVLKVIKELSEEGEVDFDFVSVNGMRLREPNQCFKEIHSELGLSKGRPVPAAKASHQLNSLFRQHDPKRRPVVLLIDELDFLCTKRQHVLYTIFDWATLPTAALTVLAIANTLDLPERLLTHRVASRLGMSRLCFQPYSFDQIQQILSNRLRYENAVDEDAISLISRKVAAISGDLRRALEICRNSVQKAMTLGKKKVTISEVQAVVREMSESGRVLAVQQASLHEKLLLRASVAEYQRTGHEEWTFSALVPHYSSLCAEDEMKPLGTDALIGAVQRLCAMRILVAAPSRATWTRPLRLNLPPDDIAFAINSAAMAH